MELEFFFLIMTIFCFVTMYLSCWLCFVLFFWLFFALALLFTLVLPSRWCYCIDVVLLACSCSFSHCFTIVFHCIMLMFSLHVIVVLRVLVVLFFSSCCSALFALVIGMSFFSSYCVVHFTLLRCYFFLHCCFSFSFSFNHFLNHVAFFTLSHNSFHVALLIFSHYCIVLLALPSLLFLSCHSFCDVTPFALVLLIPS